MKGTNDKNKKNKFYIIIIIFLVLLLFTSCNSNLFGKIGDFIKNVGNFIINKDTNDQERIVNQNLTFDGEDFEMSVSDNNLKIGFTLKNVYASDYTCTTSNADIATCYVEDDYVVVIPKKKGEVEIFLETVTNNKRYIAMAKVKIGDAVRKIELSSQNGSIYLGSNKYKYITFNLVGLKGNVEVLSSNKDVAVATIEGNVIKIEGKNSGTATVIVSVEFNGKTYTASYDVNVLKGKNNNNSSGSNNHGNSSNDNETGNNNSSNNGSLNNDNSNNSPNVSDNNEIPSNPPHNNPNTPDDNLSDTLKIEEIGNITECSIENGCSISFRITNKNEVTTDEYLDKLKVISDINLKTKFISNDDGTVTLVIYGNNTFAPTSTNISFGIDDTIISKKLDFKFTKDYIINSQDSYALDLDENSTKNIILNTNIFNGEVIASTENNTLVISDKENSNNKIIISTANNKLESINYESDENAPTSLNIKVKAKEEGTENLNIKGYINGTLVVNKNITLEIAQVFKVIFDANEGLFDIYNKVGQYEYKAKLNEEIDLSDLEPFRSADDANCTYYEFLGFNEDKNATSPSITNKYIVNGSVTLYAIYETNVKPTPDGKVHKVMWIDANILEDETTKKNMISPGSYGYYELQFKNDTGNDVDLVGMSLKENTVCTSNGCINMGYIIKYSKADDSDYTYYLSKGDITSKGKYDYIPENYVLLNKGVTNTTEHKENIDFNDKKINIKNGDTATISLFWKWVEVNDKLDTEIGKIVTDKDQYKLTLGVYYTDVFDCKN